VCARSIDTGTVFARFALITSIELHSKLDGNLKQDPVRCRLFTAAFAASERDLSAENSAILIPVLYLRPHTLEVTQSEVHNSDLLV